MTLSPPADALPQPVLDRIQQLRKEAGTPQDQPSCVIAYRYRATDFHGSPAATTLGFDYPASTSEFPSKGAYIKVFLTGYEVNSIRVTRSKTSGYEVMLCDATISLS